MKKLIDCAAGSTVTVVKNNAIGPLKQRLVSFGIMRGAHLSILAYSTTKSTVEIKVGKMQLALRSEEAGLIEVEQCS